MRPSSFTATIVLFILTSLLSSCTTTQYTLYLQDVSINGPVAQAPIHITANNMEKPLRISPHISFDPGNHTLAGELEGHSSVDVNGVFRVDTIINGNHTVSFREHAGANIMAFTGENLHWTMPSTSFGVDIDYVMSEHWALSLGTNYSTVEGKGLWGYRVGLGLFSEGVASAFRIDGGLQWQQLLYSASTIVVTGDEGNFATDDEVGFFRDTGRSTPMDFYFSLTYNTRNEDWVTNIFLQAAISKQSLAKFKPTIPEPVLFLFIPQRPLVVVHDERAEFSSTVFAFTPGVYFDIDPSARVLIGVRINYQTQIEDSSPATMLLPFLQIDWLM